MQIYKCLPSRLGNYMLKLYRTQTHAYTHAHTNISTHTNNKTHCDRPTAT